MPPILFVAPQKSIALDDEGSPVQKARTNISLPALTVLGALEESGRECVFIDQSADGAHRQWQRSDHVITFGLPAEAVLDKIAKAKYMLITSMFTFEQFLVDELVTAIKKAHPDIIVILGGIHASARPTWHFESSPVDIVVLGEGEETIVELFDELEKDSPNLSKVRGIMFRSNGDSFVRTPPRPRAFFL